MWKEKMTEKELEEVMAIILGESMDNEDVDGAIYTFEEAGVLTKDRGLVIRIGDDEFQITIVKSA